MTTQRIRPPGRRSRGHNRRRAGRLPLVVAAAVALLVSCSSNNATPTPTAASQPVTARQVSSTAPVPVGSSAPAIEPVPSLAPETSQTTETPTRTASRPTIDVKGPTLGANFSGVGDWHIAPGPSLTAISVFTQGTAGRVDISFGFHVSDGAVGVAYVGGRVSPSGTYFSLGSDTCAGAVPVSSADENGTCANLVFDPNAAAGAADPFNATLQIAIRLECKGQDYPACRETPSARSASPDEPVILDFTQSVALHGSTGCDPAPQADPPCATASSRLPAVSPVSPPESAAPANSAGPPAEPAQSGPTTVPVPSG